MSDYTQFFRLPQPPAASNVLRRGNGSFSEATKRQSRGGDKRIGTSRLNVDKPGVSTRRLAGKSMSRTDFDTEGVPFHTLESSNREQREPAYDQCGDRLDSRICMPDSPREDTAADKKGASPEALERFDRRVAELALDTRPFKQLSKEERWERLQRVMGIGRGILSTSDEFAKRKAKELELEEGSQSE